MISGMTRQQRATQSVYGAQAAVAVTAHLVTDPDAAEALRRRQEAITRAVFGPRLLATRHRRAEGAGLTTDQT